MSKEESAVEKLVKGQWRNALLTAGILCAAVIICQLLQSAFGKDSSMQLIFVLAVLLISRLTNGYFWGIFASLVSVPLVNYMFTYPYYAFNLTISGYLLAFVTMLTVSIIVSVLTTRIKQQEALRLAAEKEKLRANLLRAVSHDLRTPLTSIIGATGAILDNDLPPEKQRELLGDVNADAQWLMRMVENLLAITRIGGGDIPLAMEPEVVEDVLAEAVIKFQAHFKNVRVEVDQGRDVLLADMDAVLIEQVVQNLLENAVYHGKATRIVLNVRLAAGAVAVTVSDNGTGIPRDKLSKLFSGALQHDGGENADGQKHMGIGLSVCKSIIKAHGGTLTAANNEQGGACFTFTLPMKEDEYGQNSDH